MSNKWSKIAFTGILIIIVQLIFINKINFWGVFNPKFYAIFLLLLPKNIKPIFLMLMGFIYGCIIDFFSQTYGIGMSTSVLICFLKPYLFRIFYSKREDDESEIGVNIQGLNFIIRYLFVGLLVFHLVYFFVELGEFSNVIYVFTKALLSTILAIIFFSLFLLMFSSKSKGNQR